MRLYLQIIALCVMSVFTVFFIIPTCIVLATWWYSYFSKLLGL
jgi:hypothetical protein